MHRREEGKKEKKIPKKKLKNKHAAEVEPDKWRPGVFHAFTA